MPKLEDKFTAFYSQKKAVQINFSGRGISSEGGAVLLASLEKKHKLIRNFSALIPDYRHPLYRTHEYDKQIRQRVFLMAQGYSDCNDSNFLRHDRVLNNMLELGLSSQPTLSRMENSITETTSEELSEYFLDRWLNSLKKNQELVVIDIDSTDDPTHGGQQLAMFNGYYDQYMYQEVLLLDGTTGQVIMPVLISGTGDCRQAFLKMLRRVVEKVINRCPDIEILVRGDAGFSCPEFYEFADATDLGYCLGLGGNSVLKTHTARADKRIRKNFLKKGLEHQEIIGPFKYQAKTWHKKLPVYAKVEATLAGMNTRYVVSNMKGITGEMIYWDFYVQRGEACENRIKEIKNMCYSDRLSCSEFAPNWFRFMLSCLAYELMRLIKKGISETRNDEAKKWNVDSIRLFLLKIGASVKENVRTVLIQLSEAFPHKALFMELIKSG